MIEKLVEYLKQHTVRWSVILSLSVIFSAVTGIISILTVTQAIVMGYFFTMLIDGLVYGVGR